MNYLDSQIGKYLNHFPAYFDDENVKGVHAFHSLMKRGRTGNLPPANIYKYNNGIEVVMPVPGKRDGDFQLLLQGPHITVVHEPETQNVNREIMVQEYNYDSFSRVFRFPFKVESNLVKMAYLDGELKIWVGIPSGANPS